MSVEMRDPPRMPQPEQWLSEHPFWQLAIFAALVITPIALGWLL